MFMRRFNASASGPSGDRSPWGNFWFNPVPSSRFTSPDSAMALTAVYACVKVLAESFACMPYGLYQPSKDGKTRPKVTKHWSVRLFTKAPNRFQSPFEWRLMLMCHLALRGNAFCQIQSDDRGSITELLPLNPDRMSIDVLDGGNYRYKYLDAQNRTIYYARGELWHLRLMSNDGMLGISPISQCRAAVNEGLAMQSYSTRFFENDAKPGGGWIETPGGFNSTASKQEFRDSWQKMQGGANRGKVAVLEKGMKFHELTVSNADAQFVEARAAKVSDIARIFRIPPHKIGDLARATFSNIEQQSIEFWTDTMLPWAEMWESSIEYFLLGEDSPYEADFDMKRMLRGDTATRTALYTSGITSGWMTRNEARQLEGLDPLPELDDPLVQLTMIQADKLGEDPPEPEPGDPEDKPPADPAPDSPPAPPGKGTKGERLQALVYSNAERMARRIAAGSPPSAEVLGDALAIDLDTAAAWLAAEHSDVEEHIHSSLLVLAS